MASLGESSRMNHLMRQKSAAFRKKRGFRVQQDPELRAAFGRRRLLELFVSAEGIFLSPSTQKKSAYTAAIAAGGVAKSAAQVALIIRGGPGGTRGGRAAGMGMLTDLSAPGRADKASSWLASP